MSISVEGLQRALSDLPEDWRAESVNPGCLHVFDPHSDRYGYVFTDDRPTLLVEPDRPAVADRSHPTVRAMVMAGTPGRRPRPPGRG